MLDDLAVAAVALWFAYRLTPPHVMEECRAKASEAAAGREGWVSRLWRKLTGRSARWRKLTAAAAGRENHKRVLPIAALVIAQPIGQIAAGSAGRTL